MPEGQNYLAIPLHYSRVEQPFSQTGNQTLQVKKNLPVHVKFTRTSTKQCTCLVGEACQVVATIVDEADSEHRDGQEIIDMLGKHLGAFIIDHPR